MHNTMGCKGKKQQTAIFLPVKVKAIKRKAEVYTAFFIAGMKFMSFYS
jgi:hypothetical protein